MMDNNNKKKKILLALLILYVISPVDFLPGPIDDIILTIAYLISQKKGIAAEYQET